MLPNAVTVENFASILLDPTSRQQLHSVLQQESGTPLPLVNHVCEISRKFHASPDVLDRIVDAELATNCDDFLRDIVFHPELRDSTLLKIYDSGFCLMALAHRTGPFELLDRIARDHRVEEAILTLLLEYYATDHYTEDEFVEFVRNYRSVHGVQYELRNKRNIPEPKRVRGLSVLEEKLA